MSSFWMMMILLLWLVPGMAWLWERGVFAGLSRRTSNRKLVMFLPFFLLLLVYAQKPQNRLEVPSMSKKAPAVEVVKKTLLANEKKTSVVAIAPVEDSVATKTVTKTVTKTIPEGIAAETETVQAPVAKAPVVSDPTPDSPTGTVVRTEAELALEQMSAELKLSGVVPVTLTPTVWTDWTNGTDYIPWLAVPVRKAVAELKLPFDFPVGTNVYSNIYVSASGVIGFDRPRGSVVPEILPCDYGTNGVFLALAWGDNTFKPELGSRLSYGVESNSFCVAMEQVFSGTNVFSAKAELFDNGNIVLKYRDLPADHTIGIQNRLGGWQVATNGTFKLFCRYFGWADPEKIDTDGDGLSDYDEIYVYGSDPRAPDTDGDGLSDGDEVALGYNPMSADSNGDGLSDLLDSNGVTDGSDPLRISRVLDGYAADDQTYVPTAVLSNDAVLVTTRLILPEGAAPVGTMVQIAGQLIPVLSGITFNHSIALPADTDILIRYAPQNLPEGSFATIEIGTHRFAELENTSGVVSRFYSIDPPPEVVVFGPFTAALPLPAASGASILTLPVLRIEPEVVCVHGISRRAEAVIGKRDAHDYFWTLSPSGEIDADGAYAVQAFPGFKRSQTGTLSVRAVPMFRQPAGDYLRTASVPLRFCPNQDEEEKQPGDGEYLIDADHKDCPNHCTCHASEICPIHNCYYSMCPKEDFDKAHENLPVSTNYVEGVVLQMDELTRYRTVAVSVPEPLTNCCPCPEHTGVYTWILPNWRLKAYDSPDLTHATDRQEKRDGYVYVKGIEASKTVGDAHLTIAPKTGDVTIHQFTVFGLQLQPDFDGDGVVSFADLAKRKNGDDWNLQAGTNVTHAIVFRTDVLLPFGMVKVSLTGAPAGTSLLDSEGEDLCSTGQPWTDALSHWRVNGESADKMLYLTCPTAGSGEIVFEFMVVEDGKYYRCEKRQRFTAY